MNLFNGVLFGTILLFLASHVDAILPPGHRLYRKIMSTSTLLPKVDPLYGPYYFDQTVDHLDSESTTTFKQRYWVNSDWYKAGGPVILYNAGETAADERSQYVTNSSMAQLAQSLEGIVIVLEHRSYGQSQPGADYSTKYLKTLTTYNALEDMASIIRKIKIPNLDQDLPPAPKTKWIVYGGSYSGNLAAWMRQKYPELVFAAVPSSAPVQMSYNFYQYFQAVQKYAPAHCVRSIETVITYVDHILFSPFHKPKDLLKKQFGAEGLQHDDDFAELLTFPLGLWQAMTPDENPFGQFCAIFDNTTTVHEHVEAYASYINKTIQYACDGTPVNRCLDTHDPRAPQYTDLKEESRAWMYQVCTEYAYWQTAPPFWKSSIVSRKLTTQWYQRQCPLYYGEHDVPFRPTWRYINDEYQGWYTKLTRTFWIDGEWDPWRTLSVQSDDAPSRSGDEDAVFVVLPKAVHHWDFFVSDNVDQSIKDVQAELVKKISGWIQEDAENGDNDALPKLRYQDAANNMAYNM